MWAVARNGALGILENNQFIQLLQTNIFKGTEVRQLLVQNKELYILLNTLKNDSLCFTSVKLFFTFETGNNSILLFENSSKFNFGNNTWDSQKYLQNAY